MLISGHHFINYASKLAVQLGAELDKTRFQQVCAEMVYESEASSSALITE